MKKKKSWGKEEKRGRKQIIKDKKRMNTLVRINKQMRQNI
jgi:hypothetical protein